MNVFRTGSVRHKLVFSTMQ